MKARAEAVDATRRRVMEATRAAILDGDAPTVSMGDIARRAGVARSTLYEQYGSVAGLIGAAIFDAQLRAGFERVLALFNLDDAAEAVRKALPEGARMFESDYELTRRILVLAELDPEVRSGQATADEYRAGGLRYQAGRLAEQDKLRSGVPPDDAAKLLYTLTSFSTFDGFHRAWGMDAEAIGEFLVSTAGRCLLREKPGEPR